MSWISCLHLKDSSFLCTSRIKMDDPNKNEDLTDIVIQIIKTYNKYILDKINADVNVVKASYEYLKHNKHMRLQ